MNKIYAAGKKKKGRMRRGEAGRLGLPHIADDKHTHSLSQIHLPLKPVSLQSLSSLSPSNIHNRHPIAGAALTDVFFAKSLAKINASPFQAHVCHSVITMARTHHI